MSSVMASVAVAVHPHQIEVQDFDVYDLIIDARSAREYTLDRLPGAVNLPLALSRPRSVHGDAESEDIGAARFAGDWRVSLSQQLRLHKLVCQLQPGALVLVYCSNAGRDSEVWARCLEEMGFSVDVLAGGWPVYRDWVLQGLERLPRYMTLQGFTAAPMGGLDAVVRELVAEGEQVLVLDWIGADGGAPGFAWPGVRRVRQPRFESMLLDALRHQDASRPVWVGWCWPPRQGLQLPPPVVAALAKRPALAVTAPAQLREQAWRRLLDSIHAEPSDQARVMGLNQLWWDVERAGDSLGFDRDAMGSLRELVPASPADAARRFAETFDTPCAATIDGVELLRVDLPSREPSAVSTMLGQFRALCDLSRVGLA